MTINGNLQTFETGRHYNGPQVLEWRVVSSALDPDAEDIIGAPAYDLLVHMVDRSRDLAYEIEFFMRDRMPTHYDVLAAYDRGGNRLLMTAEADRVTDETAREAVEWN